MDSKSNALSSNPEMSGNETNTFDVAILMLLVREAIRLLQILKEVCCTLEDRNKNAADILNLLREHGVSLHQNLIVDEMEAIKELIDDINICYKYQHNYINYQVENLTSFVHVYRRFVSKTEGEACYLRLVQNNIVKTMGEAIGPINIGIRFLIHHTNHLQVLLELCKQK
ncbi:hypothetical protein NPIL_41661 [Nephila pilipes]|uniref:Uncharacterized protein n=1 Tax=Nephila pilipes TaxID=299642 RepID=A0A8X6NB77_NEPPI|nr:hypothetical protein NPIL_41661 [Nephila pilipes]